jgi:hypothetical protein
MPFEKKLISSRQSFSADATVPAVAFGQCCVVPLLTWSRFEFKKLAGNFYAAGFRQKQKKAKFITQNLSQKRNNSIQHYFGNLIFVAMSLSMLEFNIR